MARGILWVSSRITSSSPDSTTSSILTPQKFCDWYENTRIQKITSLPGIPSSVSYEAITPQPSPSTWSSAAPWLTVYEMSDINSRESPAYKTLDSQDPPEEKASDEVFKQARFDTRFYHEIQAYEPQRASTSLTPPTTTFLLSAGLEPAPGTEEDFEAWYRGEHLRMLAECEGYVRSRRYICETASVMQSFEKREDTAPKYLALHEFEGENLPWAGLKRTVETEWTKKVMGTVVREEIGWYAVKRVY